MPAGPRRAAFVAALLVAVGCSAERYEVPERTDAVRAEEARVAALVAEQHAWPGRTRPDCRVRVLGMDGATTYAWADCTVAASGDAPEGGWSTPYRVDGSTVRGPGDGGAYAADVRKLFPGPMATAILEHRDDLLPE